MNFHFNVYSYAPWKNQQPFAMLVVIILIERVSNYNRHKMQEMQKETQKGQKRGTMQLMISYYIVGIEEALYHDTVVSG